MGTVCMRNAGDQVGKRLRRLEGKKAVFWPIDLGRVFILGIAMENTAITQMVNSEHQLVAIGDKLGLVLIIGA